MTAFKNTGPSWTRVWSSVGNEPWGRVLVGLVCLVILLPPTMASAAAGSIASDDLTRIPPATPVDATVNAGSRASVVASLDGLAEQDRVEPSFTGDVSTCRPGTVSDAYHQAMLDRINWYRNMTGLPDAGPDHDRREIAQKAALMMAAANKLSHSPDPSWPCYQGPYGGNLLATLAGPSAIDLYVSDPGSNNLFVGHRRQLIGVDSVAFAIGDFPGDQYGGSANAVYTTWGDRPVNPPEAVPWPNAGFTPVDVLPGSNRWSFSPVAPGASYADLSTAQVQIEGPDGPVPSKVVHRSSAIVWEVPDRVRQPSVGDVTYTVTISNALEKHSNQPDVVRNFQYSITVVSPEPPETTITSGPAGTQDNTAIFRFQGSDGSSVFECQLDDGDWDWCESPHHFFRLADGAHTFRVRARAEGTAWDQTPAARTWTVKATNPPVAKPPVSGSPSPGPHIWVKAKAVKKRSKLRVRVNPNQVSWNYKIKIQKKARGKWKTVKVTRTRGSKDRRTINLRKGRYRVKVPAQHGLRGEKSGVVRLRR